ncbi:hypothetical protein NQ317_005115 [Molorchus minor]|uniref:Uncharacterized protein n=1 Tax=Molorchus minor TaxID=1323400 RepID=A0ABQ9JY20_9CUCU|nr:hypothetical protein NQ317_005115 [Molorchus minor]
MHFTVYLVRYQATRRDFPATILSTTKMFDIVWSLLGYLRIYCFNRIKICEDDKMKEDDDDDNLNSGNMDEDETD